MFYPTKARSSRDRWGEVSSKTFSPNCDPLQVRELSLPQSEKRGFEKTWGLKFQVYIRHRSTSDMYAILHFR